MNNQGEYNSLTTMKIHHDLAILVWVVVEVAEFLFVHCHQNVKVRLVSVQEP